MGATVIGGTSSAAKGEVARKQGAAHVIDYAREPVRDRLLELTEGRGVDVFFDNVGGSLFGTVSRVMAWDGRMLPIGYTSGEVPALAMNLPLRPRIQRRMVPPQPAQALRLVRKRLLHPGLAVDLRLDRRRTRLHGLCVGQHEGRIDAADLAQDGGDGARQCGHVEPVGVLRLQTGKIVHRACPAEGPRGPCQG